MDCFLPFNGGGAPNDLALVVGRLRPQLSGLFSSPLSWVTPRFSSVLWAASNPLLITPGVGVVFSTFTPGCVALPAYARGQGSPGLSPGGV